MHVNLPADASITWRAARRWRLTASWVLVIANALTLSRFVLAVLLVFAYVASVSATVLVVLVSVMWATDALDGKIARYARRRGAPQRLDGQGLDPIMDDAGFVAGFAVLVHAGLVPWLFPVLLLLTRVLFGGIRHTGMARMAEGQPSAGFAKPLLVTKVNGATLALGQVVLFLAMAGADAGLEQSTITAVVVGTMSVTSCVSVIQFAIRTHGKMILGILRP